MYNYISGVQIMIMAAIVVASKSHISHISYTKYDISQYSFTVKSVKVYGRVHQIVF